MSVPLLGTVGAGPPTTVCTGLLGSGSVADSAGGESSVVRFGSFIRATSRMIVRSYRNDNGTPVFSYEVAKAMQKCVRVRSPSGQAS